MQQPYRSKYYEVAEFIEPYGMWKVKEFDTQEEAEAFCAQHPSVDYQWREVVCEC